MSFYKKLFTTNILISTLYILVFSIIISIFSFNSSKKLYEKNIEDSMNNISTRVNSSIENARVLASILANNETIKAYASEDVPNYSNRTRASSFLQNDASLLLINNSHVAVTKYYDNHTLTSNFTSSFDYYCNTRGISSDQVEQLIDGFRKQNIYNVSFLFSTLNKTSFLTVAIRNVVNETNKEYYIFVSYPIDVIFDAAQYNDVLIPAVSIHKNLAYVKNQSYTSLLEDYIKTGKMKKHKIYSFTPDMCNAASDITYYFITNNKSYIFVYLKKTILTFLLCLPLLVLGFFLMKRITNSVYKPIDKLVNALPHEGKNVENEFEFFMSAFNSLESDNKTNNRIINQFKMSSKDKFIADMLFGTLPSHQISDMVNEYNLPNPEAEIVAVIIEYNDYAQLLENLSRSGIYNLKTTINSYLHSVFHEHTPCIITETSQSNHVLIVGCDNLHDLTAKFQVALLHIMEDIDIDVSATIGNPVDSYSNICDSYSSAIVTARRRILDFEHKIVENASSVKLDTETRIVYLPSMESNLITAVSDCDFDKTNKILQEIFRENYVTSNEGFAQLVIMLYSTLQKIMYNFSITEKDVFEDVSVYLDLKSCQSISSLKAMFIKHINTLMSFISMQYSSKNTERSLEMKEFIDNHYTEDISLIDLAEHMNISQEHLSRIFKQEVGINFKEYLMKYRYDKAKELIDENPNMKLKDVANAVGCKNFKTFSRLMNKYN